MCLTRVSARSNRNQNAKDVPGGAVEVTGTWDFKWAPGTKIRVAFQMPIEDAAQRDFEDARNSIIKLAETWLTAGANIDFEWIEKPLPPADDIDPQNGSPLADPKNPDAYLFSEYDVLVSLDPLPRTLRDPRTIEPLHRVLLPRSDLGAFARRADHNVPTLFIGPVTGRTETGLAECYAHDPLARFYVVHEFGHVLGLPHEHQNPKRQRPNNDKWIVLDQLFRKLADVSSSELHELESAERLRGARLELRSEISEVLDDTRQRVKAFLRATRIPLVLSEDTLDDFIYSQLIQTWPGSSKFSDWRDEKEFEPDSIMSFPFLGCFLDTHGTKVDEIVKCQRCERLLPADPKPTASDMNHLVYMYGKRP